MRVAVAGGTGVVGRQVVRAAESAGHSVVVLSRAKGCDLMTGRGVRDALADVDVVIDVANTTTQRRAAAVEFFRTSTQVLLDAEAATGVGHHVALSIVGIDRVPLGYYAGKIAQEEAIAAGQVPWTVLRATQFHEFPAQLLARTPGPVAPIPVMRSQTVAAREVAEHLVTLAAAPPAGHAPELAGPEVARMPDLARRYLRARGRHRLVLPLPVPGKLGKAMSGDGLLPAADGPRGTLTFDAWLAEPPRAG